MSEPPIDFIKRLLTHPLFALAVTLITNAASFYAGQRASLRRDRRTEFNAAADDFFAVLQSNHCRPRGLDVERFKRFLSARECRRLDEALQQHEDAYKAATSRDRAGGEVTEETPRLAAARANVLALCRRK